MLVLNLFDQLIEILFLEFYLFLYFERQSPHLISNQPTAKTNRFRLILLFYQSGVKLDSGTASSEYSLYSKNRFKSEHFQCLINLFLLVVSPPANWAALGFIMLLIRVQALRMKDVTAGKNYLRLYFEILQANAAAVLGIIPRSTFLLDGQPILSSQWQRRSLHEPQPLGQGQRFGIFGHFDLIFLCFFQLLQCFVLVGQNTLFLRLFQFLNLQIDCLVNTWQFIVCFSSNRVLTDSKATDSFVFKIEIKLPQEMILKCCRIDR